MIFIHIMAFPLAAGGKKNVALKNLINDSKSQQHTVWNRPHINGSPS